MGDSTKENLVIDGYRPGAIGRVAELHATYYQEHWGFDLFFEAKVATGLSQFLSRLNPDQDRFWGAYLDNRLIGSIVIDGSETPDEGAHLRWFMVDPEQHNLGLGRELLGRAQEFCREKGFQRVYLWTFAGLDQARRLYDTTGFTVCREIRNNQWGKAMTEQLMEWKP